MTFPWWSLLPFVAMLACIALLPIIPATSHWWEKRSSQLIIALALGIPTLVYMRIMAGTGALIETGVEYVQFIALLLALFVISGGIHLEGDIEATPRNNTAFLAVGGVLASLVGTTGAAMLLIRPILATNKERVNRVHTVLFTIFVVANCGGLLTPPRRPAALPRLPPGSALHMDPRTVEGMALRPPPAARLLLLHRFHRLRRRTLSRDRTR